MSKLEEIKEICTKEFLVPFEGTGPMTADKQFFIAYPDPGPTGLPVTVAWGITFDEQGKPLKLGELWSYQRALEQKKRVLNTFLATLLKLSPEIILEPPRRISAVLSWCYNVGLGNYKISTFRKRVNAKDWEGAATECLRWDRAGGKVMRGLTRRRQAEAAAILNP